MADVDFTMLLCEQKTLYRKKIPEKRQYEDNKISKKYVIDTKIVVNQLGSQSVILKSISAIFFIMVNCIVITPYTISNVQLMQLIRATKIA